MISRILFSNFIPVPHAALIIANNKYFCMIQLQAIRWKNGKVYLHNTAFAIDLNFFDSVHLEAANELYDNCILRTLFKLLIPKLIWNYIQHIKLSPLQIIYKPFFHNKTVHVA